MRNFTSFLLAILAPLSAASAQAFTSPPGHLALDGARSDAAFAPLAGRQMILDGEVRGRAGALKEIAVRPDVHNGYQGSLPRGQTRGSGRRWQDVRLRMSTCDTTSLSQVFSRNPTSAPVRVFSGSVTWPTLPSPPNLAVTQRPWGGARGALRFPFRMPWQYAGTADLCVDFAFTGGVLTERWAKPGDRYELDAPFDTAVNLAPRAVLSQPPLPGGCRDTTKRRPTTTILTIPTYGPTYRVRPWRNRFHLDIVSETSDSAPVVIALGFGGIPAGLAVPGLACQRLYVDFTKPTVVWFRQTSTAGFGYIGALPPYLPSAVGLEAWAQSAWTDSVSRAMKLTAATSTRVVTIPRVLRRWVMGHPSPTAVQGTAPPTSRDNPLPVFRYAR